MDKIECDNYFLYKFEPTKVFCEKYKIFPQEDLKELETVFLVLSNKNDSNDYHIFSGKDIDYAISKIMKTNLLSQDEKEYILDNINDLESSFIQSDSISI